MPSRKTSRVKQQRRRFQQLAHRLDETRGVDAVHHAVVEGRGQVHHAARHHRATAQHGPLDDAVDADDGHLGPVDDRRGDDAAQRAQAADGDGGAAQFGARGAAGTCGIGQAGHLGGRRPQVRASAWRTTGTSRPWRVSVATPMCTAPCG
jgi:hypothetical protein